MKLFNRLLFFCLIVLLVCACSSGTKSNIQKNELPLKVRQAAKYDMYFQFSSLFYHDVQDQYYMNLMELMGKADALAERGQTEYVVVVRLKEFNTVSAADRALYGIYGGKDIMESEVAVVKFDSLKTAKFRKLSAQSTDYGVVEPDSAKGTVSRAAEAIFKMTDDHLLKVDLRTEQRLPSYLPPPELIWKHSEKVVSFLLEGK